MPLDDQKDVEKDLKMFEGRWSFVSVVAGGKELPADLFEGMSVNFEGDKYFVRKGAEIQQAATVKLDPTRTPKSMDIKVTEGPDKGTVMLAIYEISGDTLKVCFDPEGKSRPMRFEGKTGSQTLVIHKRAKS